MKVSVIWGIFLKRLFAAAAEPFSSVEVSSAFPLASSWHDDGFPASQDEKQ